MSSTRGGYGGFAIVVLLAVVAFAVALVLSAASGAPGAPTPTGARPPLLTEAQIPAQYRLHLGDNVAFTVVGASPVPAAPASSPGPAPTDFPFTTNVRVTADPAPDNRPSEARDSLGRTYVAYQHEVTPTNHDVYVASSDDDGRTWSAPFPVAATAVDEANPSMIVTAGDRVSVFFEQNSNPSAFAYAQSTDRGASWTVYTIAFAGTTLQNFVFPSFTPMPTATNPRAVGGMYGVLCTAPSPSACAGGARTAVMLFTNDINTTTGWGGIYFAQPPTVELFHPASGFNSANGDLVAGMEIEIFDNTAWDLTWFRFNPVSRLFNQDGLMCGNFCPSNAYVWPSIAVDGRRAVTGAHFFNATLAAYNEILAVYATNLLDAGTPLPAMTYQLVNTNTGRIDNAAIDKKYVSFDVKGSQIQSAYWKSAGAGAAAAWFAPGINGGATFQTPTRVSDNTPATAIDQLHAVVVRNSTAGPLIAWHDSRDGNPNIYFATLQRFTVTLAANPAGLLVRFDGGTYLPAPQSAQFPAGSIHRIEAQSPQAGGPGIQYVFSQWNDANTVNPRTVTVNADITYTATLATQFQITVASNPSGRAVTVNGAPQTAPYNFWCNASASATLGAPSPQIVSPTSQYRFGSWSDAGAQTHAVTCDRAKQVTAAFVLQYQVTVATNPTGRDVVVNAVTQTGPYTFWCDNASSVSISAPSPQTLTPTSQYRWNDWSDLGLQAHSITCTGSVTITANFVLQYQITIGTNPAGRNVTIDGVTRAGPYVGYWDVNSNIGLFVPSPQAAGLVTRFSFSAWSDGNPNPSRTLVADSSKQITAVFTTEYFLTMTSNGVGTTSLNPGNTWHPAGEIVPISTGNLADTLTERYRFASWGGDITSSAVSTTIRMDGPRSVRANWVHQYKIDIMFGAGVPGAAITVDGVDIPAPISVWWNESSTHIVAAPQSFSAASDTRYNFLRWQGAGTTRQITVSVTSAATYTATYTRQFLVTLTISPAGPTVTVDGQPWNPTQPLWFDENTQHVFDAGAAPQPGARGERFKFSTWSGAATGTTSTTTLTVDAGKILTATYTKQFLLTIESPYGNPTCVNPAGTATGGCWWNENTTAQVTLTTPFQAGGAKYALTGWSEGSVSGSTVSVQMDRAKTLTASWREVTFFEEFGIYLGLLIAIIVAVIIALLLLMIRRRKKEPAVVPPPPPPVAGMQGPQQAGGTKTCPACGMEIPGAASTCPVCGAAV